MMKQPFRAKRRRLLQRLLAVGLGAAALVLSGGPAQAVSAATTTSSAEPPTCPTYNPPNWLTLAGGTPQSAKLGAPFAEPFQVTLTNTDGCPITTPLAGIAITFAAPGSGPSGTFSSSGSNAALVGTNASGSATAPQLTANTLPGGYLLTASSDFGSVSFSLVNTASGVAATITPVSPRIESAAAGSRYPQALQVQVLDANGNPVPAANVNFTLGAGSAGSGSGAGGGGAAAAGAGASFPGGSVQATELTDSSGIASSPTFKANSVAGRFAAFVTTAGVTQPFGFSLDNLAGKPPAIRPFGKTRLSATVNTRYSRPLSVKVVGPQGGPVQGETVTFTLGSSGGGAGAGGSNTGSAGASFLGGSTEATETTNADGIATSPRLTANATAGTFTATAAVAGVTNPAMFSLDNLEGTPPTIEAVGDKERAATVESHYGSPLAVKLTDRKGKPLQGQSVTFILASSGGASAAGGAGASSAGASFLGGGAQATETTNAAGIATSPRFQANGTAGTFTATATISGGNAVASFRLDNLAGKPPTVKAVAKRELSATVGTSYRHPLAVRVLDGHGRPLQGQTVTFALGAGGAASASGAGSAGATFIGGTAQATGTTNAAGIATSPRFEANTTAGTFTGTATVVGSDAAASFPLTNLAGAPAAVGAGAAATEATAVGTRFPIPPAVTVTDKHDNPVPGVLVTFSAPTAAPSGTFSQTAHRHQHLVRVRTNAAGIAVAPAFTADGTTGGYVVKADVRGAATAAFALVNQPPGQ